MVDIRVKISVPFHYVAYCMHCSLTRCGRHNSRGRFLHSGGDPGAATLESSPRSIVIANGGGVKCLTLIGLLMTFFYWHQPSVIVVHWSLSVAGSLPTLHWISELRHLSITKPKNRQSIWCYIVQCTSRLGGRHQPTSSIKAIPDTYGASWRGSGW